MNRWKLRLSVVCIGCAALLLAPITFTAVGTNQMESAYSGSSDQAGAEPTSTVQPSSTPPSPSPPVPGTGTDSGKGVTLEQQTRLWFQALSKDKEFEGWKDASWDTYPLGPGTHEWVVLIRSGKRELGYMVIASTEEGTFRLMEYGTGPNPLFSMNTLYQGLVQRGLIHHSVTYASFLKNPSVELTRWYVPPLQGVWQIKYAEGPRYFDAKTGEELPDLSGWIQPLMTEVLSREPGPAPAAGAVVKDSAAWKPADPFVRSGWLGGEPVRSENFEDWKKALHVSMTPFTYKGDWYGGLAIYPLAVSGYHRWSDGRAYIRLEHSGSRYVPFEDAALLGAYYPNL